VGNGHLPALLARVLSGLTLNAVAIGFYLSGLDIHLEAEEIRLTGQVGQTVLGVLAGSCFVNR